MTTRIAPPAFVLALLLTACDGSITGPSYLHLASLSMASSFACGIDRAGRAYCWGTDNGSGQLGTGSNVPSPLPLPVKSGVRFTQVVTGRTHVCALAEDGRAFCWGDNSESQLGVTTANLSCALVQPNGWTQDFGNACSTVPVPVETALRFKRLGAAEQRTCGLTNNGQLWCWGSGELGDSAGLSQTDTLVRVSASTNFTTFALGPYHTCAAGQDGLGWCWGSNFNGTLGLGTALSTITHALAPMRINSSAFIKSFAMGAGHTCALTSAGDALCWGFGQSGQRGDSSTVATQNDPTFVKTDRKFGAVVAASNSTCALEVGTSAAWCWGENSAGTLGDGTTSDLVAPTKVLGGLTFQTLSMRGSNYPYETTTCGVASDGVYCWGLLPQPLTFGE